MSESVLVTGASGFIGSHLVERLLSMGSHVTGVDTAANSLSHIRYRFVRADLGQSPIPIDRSIETVWHLAAHSDIKGSDPEPHFRNTFLTTVNVLFSMRQSGASRLIFTSSSAVYGMHTEFLTEDSGPLLPISPYGATKLASEAVISAAAEVDLRQVFLLRLPNVVGPAATHGVVYDLVAKAKSGGGTLEVLGDGSQRKPCLHVSELIDAMLFIRERAAERRNLFVIGPEDDGITVREIADLIRDVTRPEVSIRFTGGDRGWTGDVPRYRYCTGKLGALGWRPRLTSREAVLRAVEELHRA